MAKGSGKTSKHKPKPEKENRADSQRIDSASSEQVAFDPLLDSFADRYILPWEDRELGRIDSPLYLRPQINEAGELFERARRRWRSFDIESHAGLDWSTTLPRDYENEGWNPDNIKTVRAVHRVLLTGSRYDLSKPDELSLFDLRISAQVPQQVPNATLYASVAMRCALDAADECYRMAGWVETVASYRGKLNLAAMHNAASDSWTDRIHDALRELADEVAEAREYVALCLGAARTALALANHAEADGSLEVGERLNADLLQQNQKQGVKLNEEMRLRVKAERVAASKRKAARKQTVQARKAKSAAAEARMTYAAKLYKTEKAQHPSWGTEVICETVRFNMKISRRTLDKYLAEARREKLLD